MAGRRAGWRRALCAMVALACAAGLMLSASSSRITLNPSLAAYSDPGVIPFGDAVFAGGPPAASLSAPVVAMAVDPANNGYWVVAADGGLFTYGGAPYMGSTGNISINSPIVGIAGTPDGGGYWMVAADGGVFTFGDAPFYGSMGAVKLNSPVVGMAATPDGHGYYLAAADGGVFTFGDATFYGSMGAVKLNSPVVGIAASPNGQGYWMVAGDAGIFTFGDAGFFGTPASQGIAGWATGMAATKDGKGYWIANANGAVYYEGDAVTYGNNLSTARTEPISAIARTNSGKGYFLLEPDAFQTGFSHPGGGGAIVSIAASQIHEDPDTGYFCNPYGPCEAWCALFATWVWEQAGIPIPRYAFVGDIYTWAARYTRVLPPTARPAPGDIILYGTGPQSIYTAVHTGIVAQVWPDGSIDTIEGDAGPAPTGYLNVVINGPFLPSHSMEYNGMPIFGFAVP